MAALSETEWALLRAEWEADPRQGLTWLVSAGGGRWDISEEAVRRKRSREAWAKRGTLPEGGMHAVHLAADRLSAARIASEEARVVPSADPEAPPPPEAEARFEELQVKRAREALVPAMNAEAARLASEARAKVLPSTMPMRPVIEADGGEARDVGRATAETQDIRAQMVELHRREWKLGRNILHAAFREADKAENDVALERAGFRMRLAQSGLQALTLLQQGEARAWGLDADLIDYGSLSDAELEKLSKGALK